MPNAPIAAFLIVLGIALASLPGFLIYVWVRYAPIVGRIFEEVPVFRPLRVDPEPDGEDVQFPTSDGLRLVGTYYRARTRGRLGVVAFCHEFLADRWTFEPYIGQLRDLGFDIFTFDARNHGEAPSEPGYKPLQWVSDREVRDLRAAISYLLSRPDRDPAGLGLFGISRGGGTALCVAADEPRVWAVATDGAFATSGTMLAYILRWAEIYVGQGWTWNRMPLWVFRFAGWAGRTRARWRLHRTFPSVEKAVARLAPRPWLAIHGERDAYIGPEIARALFEKAGPPKQLWIVPGAKHNRCREIAPDEYRARITAFFRQYAPRQTLPPVDPARDSSDDEPIASPADSGAGFEALP